MLVEIKIVFMGYIKVYEYYFIDCYLGLFGVLLLSFLGNSIFLEVMYSSFVVISIFCIGMVFFCFW